MCGIAAWFNRIRDGNAPPDDLLPIFPAHPVEGLVKVGQFCVVVEQVDLRIAANETAEPHADEANQHSALV